MDRTQSRYNDIIDLPHHQSKKHPQMSLYNRAAQFSAFQALTGYGEMVQDTADILLLDKRMILDEDSKNILDRKMQLLMENIKQHPEITVIYFDGAVNELGVYCTYSGEVKKIEECPTVIVFEDGKKIMAKDIIDLNVDLQAKMVKEQ